MLAWWEALAWYGGAHDWSWSRRTAGLIAVASASMPGRPCRPLPEIARNCATRTLASSSGPILRTAFTCAVVWGREVLCGGVNDPSIDGKDAVRQSALRPATAGYTAAVSWSATGSPDTAHPKGSWRRAIALRQPRVDHEGCLSTPRPTQSVHRPHSFSNVAAYRTNQRLLALLS